MSQTDDVPELDDGPVLPMEAPMPESCWDDMTEIDDPEEETDDVAD